MSALTKPITYSPFRWFVLVTLFVVTATTAIALISPAPLIGAIFASQLPDPSLAGDVLSGAVPLPAGALSVGEVAWMTMGWFNFAVAIAALLGGWFVDRFGFVKVYVTGVALVGLGWLLMGAFGDSYSGMMVIRTIQGLGTGPVMASTAAVAALRFPAKERSIVTGTQGAAMAAGVGLGQAFMSKVLDAHGGDWQAALVSLWPIAAVALVMAVAVAFGPKQEQVVMADLSAAEQNELKHALRRALLHPVTWAAVACVFILSWVYQAFNDLSPVYLTDPDIGTGFANGSALLGVGQLFNFAGAFAAGAVTEKIFRGRVRPGIMIGFTLGAVFGLGMLLPAATTNATVMGIVVCVAAFFFAWINPNALAYIAKTYPASIVGKLGGYAMGIGIFGGTLGVAAGAGALHATGRYTVSIVIMALVCAAGVIPGLFLRQSKSPEALPQEEPSVARTGA